MSDNAVLVAARSRTAPGNEANAGGHGTNNSPVMR
jgi:hypothetical protein